MANGNSGAADIDTENSLDYGDLSPSKRIYQSFCGDIFSIILMFFYYNKPYMRKAMFSYFSNAGRVTAAFMHARLIREHNVAEGYDICDYRYVGDREK